MRILITGGFGHLGGRLALHLIKNGHEIILSSRKKKDIPYWLPLAQVVKLDFFDLDNLSNALKGVDQIIHTASMNNIDCFNNPELAYKFNVKATENILLAATKSRVKRFIFLSTIHVYSSTLQGTFDEESSLLNNHPFAKTKKYAEQSIKKICSNYAIDYLILRLSNITGPPAHRKVNTWGLFTNQICLSILKRKEFIIKNPYESRDFLSIKTFIDFISNAIEEKNIPQVINVCSSKSIKIIDFAKLIINVARDDFQEDPKIDFQKSNMQDFNTNLLIKSNRSYSFRQNNLEYEIRQIFNFIKENY